MPSVARLVRGLLSGCLTGAVFVSLMMSLFGGSFSYFGLFLLIGFGFLALAVAPFIAALLYALHRIGWRSWGAIIFAGGLSVMLGFILVEWVLRGEVGAVPFTVRPIETIGFVLATGILTSCVSWWVATATK